MKRYHVELAYAANDLREIPVWFIVDSMNPSVIHVFMDEGAAVDHCADLNNGETHNS